MKKILTLLITLSFCAINICCLTPSFAKQIETTTNVTNIAQDKVVYFTALDGTTKLYPRPWVNAKDPISDTILTGTGVKVENYRFDTSICLGTTVDYDKANGAKSGFAVLDFGGLYNMSAVKVQFWNDWTFTDILVQVASKNDFSDAITVFCNDTDNTLGYGNFPSYSYQDVFTELKEFSFDSVQARYIRFTNNAKNDGYALFSRLEVYGSKVNVSPTTHNEVAKVYSNKASGTYSQKFNVELKSAYESGEIFYTTDGTYPTEKSTKYTAPIDIRALSDFVFIRAIVKVNGITSFATNLKYAFKQAYKAGDNIALGIMPSAYGLDGSEVDVKPHDGNNTISCITDGIQGNGNSISLKKGDASVQGFIQIDFGGEYSINEITMTTWHDHYAAAVIIQLSTSEDFTSGVTTVFSNDTENRTGLNIAPVTLDTRENAVSCYENMSNHGEVGNTTTKNGNVFIFNPIIARYIRITSLDTERLETIMSEIQAITDIDSASGSFAEEQHAIVSVDNLQDRMIMPSDTTKEDIENRLTNSLNVTLDNGEAKTVSGVWNWGDIASVENDKEYNLTFTFDENIADPFNLMNALIYVEKAADLTALKQKIAEIGTLDENTYTSSSWKVLKDKLFEANNLIEAQYKTQSEVDNALNNISTALSKLVLRGDVSLLMAKYDAVKNYSENDFTASSFSKFEKILSQAALLVAINGNADSDQQTVDECLAELNKVISSLVEKASAEEVSNLQTLINEKKAAFEIGKESSTIDSITVLMNKIIDAENLLKLPALEIPKKQVNQVYGELSSLVLVKIGDISVLKQKFDEYKSVYGLSETTTNGYLLNKYVIYLDNMYQAEDLLKEGGNKNSSQNDVNLIIENLANAVKGLEKHADKAALNAKIEEIELLNKDKYTAKSYNNLLEQLSSAKTISQKILELTTIKEVQNCLENLITAQNALVILGDSTELKKLISDNAKLKLSSYTADSYKTFKTAYDEAKLLLEQDEIGDEEIANATKKLTNGISSLVAIGNKTDLLNTINSAAKLNADDYSSEKWATFMLALNYAKSVKESNNVDQNAVDEANAMLQVAVDNLSIRGSGCNAHFMETISVLMLALSTMIIFLRRKA